MKFQTRLYVGFGLVLFITCVISFVMFLTLSRMNNDMELIVHDKYVKARLTTELRNEFVQLDRRVLGLFIRTGHSRQELDEMSEVISSTSAMTTDLMQEMRNQIYLPSGQAIYMRIHAAYNEYYDYLDQVIHMLRDARYVEALQMVSTDMDTIRQQLDHDILQFKSIQESEMEATLTQASDRLQLFVIITFALVAVLLLCSLVIAVWSVRRLRDSLQRVVGVLNTVKYSEQEALPRITVEADDEIGRIAEAFNVMADSLEKKTLEQRLNEEKLIGQHWIKSMVAEVTKGYQGIEDMTSLARWFISKVTPMVGATYGIFYYRHDDMLIKEASYAASGESFGKPHFLLGEGLIGQCAREQKPVIIDAPPVDYIRIRSGIGDAPPRQIVILPVTFRGRTEGVVELASFHELNETSMELLEELIETLGVTISSIAGQMQVQKLLKEAQVFTEELQTQSEELQQQQEELTTLNEQLGDQFKQTEQRNKQLEMLKLDLESKNDELLQASRYKSEFLANISHELRTPLNSILVLSQILVENAEDQLSDKQLEYVQTIYSSGNELLKLINEILDLSKIESGKMTVIVDEVPLQEFVIGLVQHFKVAAEKKAIAFDIKLDASLERDVLQTDGQKLQQIIRNLLSNAMKFTEYGRVCLSVYPLTNDEAIDLGLDSAQGEWLAFEVKDTGIGIPQEKLDMIFESFQQADGTTSRKYGGTGLGLAISKQLVELLNGTIRVASEVGVGSTFTIYIPKRIQPDAEAPKSGVKEQVAVTVENISVPVIDEHSDDEDDGVVMDNDKLKGRKILLIDDDMRNIYALTSALENYGFHVIFAENGKEGLGTLEEHADTDLILMDIMMPRMDGYEAIRKIREQPRFAELPIIALTAKAMKDDRDKCMEAGANDYISKPVNIRQLLSLIHVWLSG